MRVGRVTGNVVSTINDPTHKGKKLMLVSYFDSAGQLLPDEHIIADAAQAGIGDLVLVSEDGSAAELEFGDDPCVLDGVIVGIVDEVSIKA